MLTAQSFLMNILPYQILGKLTAQSVEISYVHADAYEHTQLYPSMQNLCNKISTIIFFNPFFQGVIESISIGEIKLKIKESLLDLGLILSSRNPIFELIISDISLAMRTKSPSQSPGKKKSKPPSKKKAGSGGGKGKKLMMLTKAARFLSVSVFNIIFKVC